MRADDTGPLVWDRPPPAGAPTGPAARGWQGSSPRTKSGRRPTRLLIISGDAGMGKSLLLAHAANQAMSVCPLTLTPPSLGSALAGVRKFFLSVTFARSFSLLLPRAWERQKAAGILHLALGRSEKFTGFDADV